MTKLYFYNYFVNAPTKRKAEQRARHWIKKVDHATKVVITNSRGGTTGDSYGKNYLFDGYSLVVNKKVRVRSHIRKISRRRR